MAVLREHFRGDLDGDVTPGDLERVVETASLVGGEFRRAEQFVDENPHPGRRGNPTGRRVGFANQPLLGEFGHGVANTRCRERHREEVGNRGRRNRLGRRHVGANEGPKHLLLALA